MPTEAAPSSSAGRHRRTPKPASAMAEGSANRLDERASAANAHAVSNSTTSRRVGPRRKISMPATSSQVDAGHADRVVVDERRLVRHRRRQRDHCRGNDRNALAPGHHEARQDRGADHRGDREQEARHARGPQPEDRAVRADPDLERHGHDGVQQRRVVGREDRQLRLHVRDHAANVWLVQLRQVAVGDPQRVGDVRRLVARQHRRHREHVQQTEHRKRDHDADDAPPGTLRHHGHGGIMPHRSRGPVECARRRSSTRSREA